MSGMLRREAGGVNRSEAPTLGYSRGDGAAVSTRRASCPGCPGDRRGGSGQAAFGPGLLPRYPGGLETPAARGGRSLDDNRRDRCRRSNSAKPSNSTGLTTWPWKPASQVRW
jgi:hypothetical protein